MNFKKFINFLFCFSILSSSFLFKIVADDNISSSLKTLNPVKLELISEKKSIIPGEVFKLGILLNIQKGYHVYWKHPGEFGLPLNVTWRLPEDFSVISMEWVNPQIYKDQLTVFGYEKEAMIIATIKPSKNLDLERKIPIGVQVEWLACANDCISGSSLKEIELSVSNDRIDNTVFKETKNRFLGSFPKENDNHVKISLNENQELVFQISNKIPFDFDKVLFIPESKNIELIDFSSSQTTSKILEETSLVISPKNISLSDLDVVKGLLLFQGKNGDISTSLLIEEPISISNLVSSKQNLTALRISVFSSTFFMMLFLAFVGGIVLNIMPCVLPLITLKVYGLIKTANEEKSTLLKHGAFFAFGVISCFWLLALIAFLMKILGHNIGWGFQLQEPIFVAILAVFFFLFALSSLGVFQIGTVFLSLGNKSLSVKDSINKSKLALLLGSFFNGLLATLVTTPCTGPFLGSILGLVMSLSLMKQFLIFSSIGLGMSFPYLLFSIFPKLISFLPKPGNWMVVFKQVVGFIMMLTVLWLTWIFASETSLRGLFYLLFSLLLSSFAAWLLGKWGSPVVTKLKRQVISIFAGCLILVSLSIGVYASKMVDNEPQYVAKESSWETFSSERLSQLRKEGKNVFIDFTAKWCLTCQANKPVLHNKELEQFFEDHGIIKMIADWTRKDPEISLELSKLGRASVPAYVFYPGNGANPILLPQTLSFKIIEKEISSFFK